MPEPRKQKALLPVARAKRKGREQGRLGDPEAYIYISACNQRAPPISSIQCIDIPDLPRAAELVVVGGARWAVFVVG